MIRRSSGPGAGVTHESRKRDGCQKSQSLSCAARATERYQIRLTFGAIWTVGFEYPKVRLVIDRPAYADLKAAELLCCASLQVRCPVHNWQVRNRLEGVIVRDAGAPIETAWAAICVSSGLSVLPSASRLARSFPYTAASSLSQAGTLTRDKNQSNKFRRLPPRSSISTPKINSASEKTEIQAVSLLFREKMRVLATGGLLLTM